jgi:hypothetical protein
VKLNLSELGGPLRLCVEYFILLRRINTQRKAAKDR